MTSQLKIYLLGHLRLTVDGKPVRLKGPPKTVPLWAYLLLHRSQPIPRETLSFTLWPDEPEKVARTNLRRHLYHLNRGLPAAPRGTPWIRTDAETIQWNPEADFWLDVAEFERLSASPDTLAEAVGYYTGDLLIAEYDDWIFYHRERLRSLFLSNLNQLVQHHRSRREYSQAIAYSSQLLAFDPLREDAVRQLMALRYESADRAGALRDYEGFLVRLREELGVEPMPETVALFETILREKDISDPLDATGGLRPALRSGSQPTLPFVGREAEIEALTAWWRRAAQGQGQLVLAGGEAGVGKTRLVEEFAHLAEAQGGRLLRGGTSAMEPVPYQAILSALRSALPMLAALEIDPIWLAAVAEVIPEIRARRLKVNDPLTRLASIDPESDRVRLYEGIARCLEGLAEPRPVILILEDLHWAGDATASLLEFIARRAPQHALLLLVTYRPEETPIAHPLREMRRKLQSENLLNHLSLGPLTPSAVHSLVEQISGLGETSSALAARLYAASEGNPFFLLELIRDLIESGDIQVEEGRWQFHASIQPAVPREVGSTILNRIARLPAQAKSLAEVAAVIGSGFNVELVREVSGWSESQILDALDALMDHQLVREAEGGGRFNYTFTHHLFQAAIYDIIPRDIRKRRHRRVAHLLEALGLEHLDDLAAEMAVHWDRGGEPERAATYYLRTARRALAAYADEEALAALDRSLDLVAVDSKLRFDALALREDIHHRQGDRPAQAADLETLSGLAAGLEDPDLICEGLRRQIRYRRALGDRHAEGELIEALKTRTAGVPDSRWRAEALRLDATYQAMLSRYEAARSLVEEALPIYHASDDVRGQVACLCLLGEVAVHQSRFSEADALLQQAEAMVAARGDRALLVRTLGTASQAAFAHRDFPSSLALAERMLSVCQTIGDREGAADARARMGSTLARQYRIQEAREHYRQAAALYDELGKRQGQAAVLLNRGMLETNLGRYTAAIEMFRHAETLFEAMDDLRGLASCALNLSATAIYQGDYTLAEKSARRSHQLAVEIQMPFLEAIALGNLGEARFHQGDLSDAIAYLGDALAVRRKQDLPPEESAADLSVLAIAYLHAGETEKARKVSEELLELYTAKAETLPYPQQALWAAVQCYRALGESDRAADLLEQAHAALQVKAAAIPDLESRTGFLNLPFNRQILDAYQANKTR